ncbi:unnamed protein product [Dicrocoelium dendriticum]|nr:unnamed protein product [Dicrocoelium dendriticum]
MLPRQRPGDCILSVNGISLLGVTHEEAVRTLQSAGPRLKLVIERGYRTSDMTNSSSFLLDSPHFHSRLGHVPPSHPRLTHEPNDRQMPHRPTGPGTTVEDGKCGSVAVTSSSLVSGSSIEPQSSGSRSEAVTYNGMSERVKRREQRPMKVKTDQNKPRDSSQAASKHDTENKGTSPSARPTTVSRRLKKSAPTSFPAFSWCAGLQKTNGCSALLTTTNRHSSASQHRLSSRRRGEAGKSRSQSSIVQISSKSSRPLPAPKPGPVVVEVILTRGTRSGLGFSIAGGVNNEAVDGDPGIFITKMTPGGVADTDGRLHVGDRIVQVNGISLVEVSHEQAVNALKQAGDRVQMIVVKQPGVKMAKTSRAIKTESVVRQQLPHSNSCDTISNQVTSPDSARLSGAPIHNHRLRRSSSSSSAELDKQAEYLEQPTAKSQGGGDGHCQGLLEAQMSGLIDYAAAASVADLVSRWPNARLVTVFRSGRSVGATSPAHPVSHSPNKRHRSQSVGGNLGLHIVGGDGSEATFISYVHPTKPAGASKRLFVGDRVLAVNGIDVTEYGHEQAAAALRNAPDRVDLVLAYCPEEYAEFERCYARQLRAVGHKLSHQTAKRLQTELHGTRPGKQRHRKRSTGESKSLTHRVQHTESTPTSSPSDAKEIFLRCQVDYDPLKDSHQAAPKKAFTLRSGDLICVTNQTDPEWWQAQRLNPTANEPIGPVGLVPSRARLERRERLRTRHVNFFARTRRPSTSGSTTHSQGGGLDAEEHATNQRLGFSLTDKKKERHRRKDSDTSDSFVLSYIPVTAVQLSFARPVVILGSMKDRISDDLLNEYPDRFGTAVPHTTRSSRPNEVEGRDYHFVLSREIMVADIAAQRYLEAGEYKGNLYGTHLESVFEVAELGLHCLLDVGGPALRRLEAAGLPSIAVLILPEAFPPQNSGSQLDVKKPFEEQSQLLGSSDSASSLNAQTKISRLLRHFSGYLTGEYIET